jgi:hypothetical protein
VRRSMNSRSAIQPDGAVASIKSSEDSNRGAECGGDLRLVGGVMIWQRFGCKKASQ